MGVSLYGLCRRHCLPQKSDCKPALSQEIQSRQHASIAHLVNPSTRKCVFLTSIQAKGQIIHCYSKKEQGHPRLLRILADPNKHAVLGEPKTPASAGLFPGTEFSNSMSRLGSQGKLLKTLEQSCRKTRGLISTNVPILITRVHLARKVCQVRSSIHPSNHPANSGISPCFLRKHTKFITSSLVMKSGCLVHLWLLGKTLPTCPV